MDAHPVSRDCPRCDRVILDSYKHETILRGRLLLVEVPHLEPTYAKIPTSYGRDIRMAAKLSLSKKWLVNTPVLIHLEEGVVRQVGGSWDPGVLEGFLREREVAMKRWMALGFVALLAISPNFFWLGLVKVRKQS